ncbi:MAG: isocitrate lyase/phosphoenolpyruvate mutase family protein [Acidobacteria bacterium]|nr:isocitrate lyase/phosphoenolpyruvate mutase family protein [Acidobacteriota bacterium]
MTSLAERHRTFFELHQSGCFVVPNPWDLGSARLMAACGAKALATTSAGFAFTLGRPDMGHVTRDEALHHAEQIVSATPLPVTGDLENGFGDDPTDVAETVRLAREAGLSGCSIEDTRMVEGNPAYEFDLALERIGAAADAASTLDDPFVLCARADGLIYESYGMDEAIRRIQAFANAGADLLYVPLLPDMESLQTVVASVTKPVNALAAGALAQVTVPQLAAMGVRRISVGAQIARLTHAAIRDATRAMLTEGSFTAFASGASSTDIDAMLTKGADGKQ